MPEIWICCGAPSVGTPLPEDWHDNPNPMQNGGDPNRVKLPILLKDARLLKTATHFWVPVWNHTDP